MEKSSCKDTQKDGRASIALATLTPEDRQALDEFLILLARAVARIIDKESADRRTNWEIWDDIVVAHAKSLVVKHEQHLVLSVGEVSEILGITQSLTYRAVHSGQIPSIKIGDRILIPRIALYKMLENIYDKSSNTKK